MWLTLIAYGVAISLLIWGLAWIIGVNQLERDYLRDYDRLRHMVCTFQVTARNFRAIKKRFDLISKYKCRNYEKLQVLEQYFYKRFAEAELPVSELN